MSSSDPHLAAALAAAQDNIRATAAVAVGEVANNLLALMKTAGTYRERGKLAFAQIHILENRELFLSSFAAALRERVEEDIAAQANANTPKAKTDWQSISLVGEEQIEEQLSFERIGKLIEHASEAELRDLAGYMSSLLRFGWADPERNPLRGDILGSALHKAIEKITEDSETQKIFAREIGQAMANVMPACYREIIAGLQQRAVRPVDLAMRAGEVAPGRAASSAVPSFEDARKAWEASWQGRMSDSPDTLRSWESSILGRHGNVDPLPEGFDLETSAALLDRLLRGGMPGSQGAAWQATRGPASVEADAELMNLLRRLNGGASYRGEFDALPRDTGYGSKSGHEPDELAATRRDATGAPPAGTYYSQPPALGLSDLMAANIIRAHREELMQASRGKLDHLVIEVVASLFDQILSDSRVPPQMARQIARLQLPVLRVALIDSTFFSSRRHPVRRFINRVASLACAFDEFEVGPGKELLSNVGILVKQIVEGDFDQLELYDAKLNELERFTAEQTHAEVRESAAAETLRGKELEWRVQRRFSQKMHAALEPLALPPFVRDFLSGVWAQTIVLAARNDAAHGTAQAQQLRRTGVELVTSIQPKRSLEQRKEFLASLPTLMRELTAGMKSIELPKPAQDDFFGQLISQHAGSLKGAPHSELDHNMRLRHLDAAFKIPVPTADEAREEEKAAPEGSSEAPVVEQQFSVEEGRAIGLIGEGAVDWSSCIAPEEGVESGFPAAVVDDDEPAPLPPLAILDPDLAPEPADGDRAAAGASTTPSPALRDQLQLGFSYQLNLKDRWEKVRLTYMSPGRTLFLFAHGDKDRETISMTSRTLSRLCDIGRMRAFENAFLIDRATERARQQLAMLGKATASSTPALRQ